MYYVGLLTVMIFMAHPINLGEEALCFETNIVSLPYGQSRTISVGAIDIAIRDTF